MTVIFWHFLSAPVLISRALSTETKVNKCSKNKNKTKVLKKMSSCNGELVFGRLLICLGYEDKEKYLTNRNLFVVPNKDAFQKVSNFSVLLEFQSKISKVWNYLFFQIIHFLFYKFDNTKSEVQFRDCWPIFDKKVEADFRRVCFNWYKELQVVCNKL